MRFQPCTRTIWPRHHLGNGAAKGGAEKPTKNMMMTSTSIYNLRLPNFFNPDMERTVSGRDLEEALDAWLADDMAREDYQHILSWNDDDEEVLI